MKVIILLVQYVIFGVVDNLIMYKTGEKLDSHIESFVLRLTRGRYTVKRGNRMVFLCAAIGNAISDLAGGLAGGNIALGVCSFLGCMVIALWIARGTFVRVS